MKLEEKMIAEENAAPAPARRAVPRWVYAFVGFFLVFGAWAFAAPYGGPADELQHVIRAAGVVSGQIAPAPKVLIDFKGDQGMGAIQQVSEGLNKPATCWGAKPRISAACQDDISGGPTGDVATTAGRYNPTYYFFVGLPLKFWPGWAGLVLARLISAALSAALLAASFHVLWRYSRQGLMLAGLVAASTPMLAHLAGAVNPNGLEIAAGIALFAAGIPLFIEGVKPNKALVTLFGIGTVLLAAIRPLGPLWVASGLAILLLPPSWPYAKRLLRDRLAVKWTLGIVVSLLFAIGWALIMKTGDVSALKPADPSEFNWTLTQAAIIYFDNWGTYIMGMVGVAGWFDVFIPQPFYWAWAAAVGSLMIFALVVGTRWDRWRFAIAIVGGVVIPGVLQVSQASRAGFIIGGRYMLPLMVVIPLLGAFIVERRLLSSPQSSRMIRLFLWLMLPAHVVLLDYALVRWQKGGLSQPGLGHLFPFGGDWTPPLGTATPLLCMVAGLGVLWWLFRSRTLTTAGVEAGEPETTEVEA